MRNQINKSQSTAHCTKIPLMLIGLLLFVFPLSAMDQEAQNCIISNGLVDLRWHPDFPKPLNVGFVITIPDSVQTQDGAQTYVDVQRPIIHEKLNAVLRLYLKQLDDDLENEPPESPISSLRPTHVFFYPETNMISLIQEWGKHTVSRGVTARLKARVDCKYDLNNNAFTSGPRIIHITQKQPTVRKFTATMEMLLEHFSIDRLDAFNPDSLQKLLAIIEPMRAVREAGIATGKDPDTLPNHVDPLNNFLFEDLKKVVAQYVLNQDILDVN